MASILFWRNRTCIIRTVIRSFARYEDFIREMSETAVATDSFDPALYEKYNVKRDLETPTALVF